MKTTKLFKVLFITFFSIYFLKYAPVYADTNIKTLDLTAKTTVKDPYCKGVVYSFNLPAGGVNFRGMSGYVSMTPTEPIFTQTLIWAANLPNGDCPPSGSLLNREDGSTVYPQTDGAPWFASYILKNSENKYVRLNTDFILPKPIPMKGCVIVIVGGCGAVTTEITSESHMKMLYDTEPFDKSSKPSLVPLSYEYGYGGGGGASGGANCSGSQCAFASVWKADKDYDLHFFHGSVAGGGFSPVADPPQGNWDADFDYYLYKNCDNLKQGINGPSDYYREIPADAMPLLNLRQNVINNAPQTSSKDKISSFGGTGDLPVVGDWNGDGKTEIGNYKGNGVWVLDYDGSYVWDGASVDKVFSFGSSTDKPITGDWNGDGKDEIGNYKGNGMFALDQNGNGAWDGASVDKVFNFAIANPSSSDLPVVGDWNGDGKTEIGIYQPITKKWYLDYNGNGAWDTGTDKTYQFGGTGDLPVVGDWNGDGKDEIGVYRSSTYLFYLAYKQNMVCAPKTCAMLGNYQCGSWSDGCGATISCGACTGGKTCSAGQCVSNCSGRASKKCADGNLYWYNSCNAKEELAQNCVAEKKTCQNGVCVISGGGSGGGGGTVEPEEPKQLTRAEILQKIAEVKQLLIQLIIQLIAELQKQLAAMPKMN